MPVVAHLGGVRGGLQEDAHRGRPDLRLHVRAGAAELQVPEAGRGELCGSGRRSGDSLQRDSLGNVVRSWVVAVVLNL